MRLRGPAPELVADNDSLISHTISPEGVHELWKEEQEPQDCETFYKFVSLVRRVKAAPLVCNFQNLGTDRGNPVRKGKQEGTVKFQRWLTVSRLTWPSI